MVMSAWVFGGLGEWAVRMPALIATLAIGLMVHSLVRSVASRLAALMAASLAMLTPSVMLVAAIGETDVLTTAFCFAAFSVIVQRDLATGRGSCGRWISFGLLIGCAALSKGPISLIFPVGGISYFLLLHGPRRELLFMLPAVCLAATMLAVWVVPNLTTDVVTIWWSQMRLDTALHRPSLSNSLFTAVAFITKVFAESLPTSLLALPAMVPSLRRRLHLPERLSSALVCYSLVGTTVLMLASAAQARYAMPAVPAFAVLAGLLFDVYRAKSPRFLRLIMILLIGLSSFQVIRGAIIAPLRANVVQHNKQVGIRIDEAISRAPAPLVLLQGPHDMNCLFYLRKATQDLISPNPPIAGPVWVLFGNRGESWPAGWVRTPQGPPQLDVESRNRQPFRLYRIE